MSTTIKRIISVLVVVITVFSSSVLPASAKKEEKSSRGITTYSERYHDGVTAPLLSDFLLDITKKINVLTCIFAGMKVFDEDKLEFAAEGFADDIIKELAETTFIDGYDLADNIPLVNKSAQRIIKVFRIDLDSEIPALNEKIGECNEKGETVKAFLYMLFQTYLKQVISVHVYEKQINDTTYQMICESTYKYGGTETYELDFYYDTEKQLYYSESDSGLFNLGFHFDVSTKTLFGTVHPWQRNFGFRLIYDILANIIVMDYDTERIKFTYDGKDWMIQLWKGRYFVCPGAEIGIYNRDKKKIGSYYDCAADDELMNMYMELYHEDELIFTQGPMMHWWLTGFNFNTKYYLPESLTLKGTIEFPSKEMADLFTKAASKKRKIKVKQEDVKVSFEFK